MSEYFESVVVGDVFFRVEVTVTEYRRHRVSTWALILSTTYFPNV
jgi:hypothetical protein